MYISQCAGEEDYISKCAEEEEEEDDDDGGGGGGTGGGGDNVMFILWFRYK